MLERANRLNRLLDKYLGIPLTIPAFIFRKIDKLFALKKKAHPHMQDAKLSIGVVCFGAIGDLLLVSGLLNGIKELYPKSETTLFTSTDNSIVCELLPNVNTMYSIPITRLIYTISMMRRANFDILIDTTQWARIGAIVCALSGARSTVGFKTSKQLRSLPYDIKVQHNKQLHEWENFMALLCQSCSAKPAIAIQGELVSKLVPRRDFVICHMFARGSHRFEKEWQPEKWAELAKFLASKNISTVFTGSIHEQTDIDDFISQYLASTNFLLNLAGRLTLEEIAQLSLKARAVVSVNTGIMHLTALCGAFTIGLHGPSNPDRWGPIGEHVVSLAPQGIKNFPNMEFKKTHDDSSFARHIEVKQVIEVLSETIN